MLDTGKLLTQGEVGLERRRQGGSKSKEDDSDISLIYFSPTINYAGLERFSPSKKLTDRQSSRSFIAKVILISDWLIQYYTVLWLADTTSCIAKVALQVMVEPGSYKVGESQVRNKNTEWHINIGGDAERFHDYNYFIEWSFYKPSLSMLWNSSVRVFKYWYCLYRFN